jgi:hypothetical protein
LARSIIARSQQVGETAFTATRDADDRRLERMLGQIVGDGDRCGRGVSGRQHHVTGSGVVVDVPAVEALERRRIAGQCRGVVADRPHVFVRVVVPPHRGIRVAGEVVGGQIAACGHDAVVG